MGGGFGKSDKVRLDSYSMSAGVEMNRSCYGNELTLYGTQWAEVRECVMQISGVFLARPLPRKPMSPSFTHTVYLTALVFFPFAPLFIFLRVIEYELKYPAVFLSSR